MRRGRPQRCHWTLPRWTRVLRRASSARLSRFDRAYIQSKAAKEFLAAHAAAGFGGFAPPPVYPPPPPPAALGGAGAVQYGFGVPPFAPLSYVQPAGAGLAPLPFQSPLLACPSAAASHGPTAAPPSSRPKKNKTPPSDGAVEPAAKRLPVEPQLPSGAPFTEDTMFRGQECVRVGVFGYPKEVIRTQTHGCVLPLVVRASLGYFDVTSADFAKFRADLCKIGDKEGHGHAADISHLSPRVKLVNLAVFRVGAPPGGWPGLPAPPPTSRRQGFGRPPRK